MTISWCSKTDSSRVVSMSAVTVGFDNLSLKGETLDTLDMRYTFVAQHPLFHCV